MSLTKKTDYSNGEFCTVCGIRRKTRTTQHK